MRIALVSDTHLSPADTLLRANWLAVERWIASESPDLVVHLGDITANGAENPDEFEHAYGCIADSHNRVLFLPGNHDVGDNPYPDHEGREAPLELRRLREYRAVFGPDWWSLSEGRWLIIGLNAQLLGTDTSEEAAQSHWLENTLAPHAGPLGVFTHKPLAEQGKGRGTAPTRYPPKAPLRRLLDRLAGYDLRFISSGHTHQFLRNRTAGTEHIWIPSASFIIPDRLQDRTGGKCVGTALLHLDDSGYRLRLHLPPGLTQHNLFDLAHIYPEIARDSIVEQ